MGVSDVTPPAVSERLWATVATGQAVVEALRRHRITVLAGSFAFHAFVSLLPLLLFVFVLVTVVLDESLAVFVVRHTSGYLTPGESQLVADAVMNDQAGARASLLGIVVLLWGTLKVFRQLDVAFDVVYDVEDDSSLRGQLLDGFVVLLAMVGAVLLILAANVVLDRAASVVTMGFLKPPLIFAGLTLVFLPLYYLMPGADLSLRETVPGAVLAAFGWMVLEVAFRAYLATTGQYEAYGLIGGLLLLMLWLYAAGLVLMTGAVVNAVVSGRAEAV